MDKRIKSAKPRSAVRSRMRSLSDKLLLAMTIDKACGGPLLNFLRRSVSLHVQLAPDSLRSPGARPLKRRFGP